MAMSRLYLKSVFAKRQSEGRQSLNRAKAKATDLEDKQKLRKPDEEARQFKRILVSVLAKPEGGGPPGRLSRAGLPGPQPHFIRMSLCM